MIAIFYVAGDIHGSQYKWNEQIDPVLKAGDVVIVTGDFGVGFFNGRFWTEENFFDWMEQQPYTVLFCDGNHCNFDKLFSYPIREWNGGKVHFLRRNLIHLMRGEVYRIDGRSFFVMGGGYSLDKARRTEGRSWWPQEMPSQAEYANAHANLDRCGHAVDYIITHTAPFKTVYRLSRIPQLSIRGDVIEEMELTRFLDEVASTTTYQKWYFGHFHIDRELWPNQYVLLSTVRELESGRIVRRWDKTED